MPTLLSTLKKLFKTKKRTRRPRTVGEVVDAVLVDPPVTNWVLLEDKGVRSLIGVYPTERDAQVMQRTLGKGKIYKVSNPLLVEGKVYSKT